MILLAIIGDAESPDLPKWQSDLDMVRHVFRDVFSDNQLAARCAGILDEILLPGYLTSSENWPNLELEPWSMDLQAWPTEITEDFFNILGCPPSGSMGM